jgi:hypothetical protein
MKTTFILNLSLQVGVNLDALLQSEELDLPSLVSMKKSRMTTNRNDESVAITFDVRILFY